MSTATSKKESALCIGSLLGAARIKQGIPIEQAAHDTRIRTQRLLEIEGDDFSQFAHPSYSRMFLMDYASYLGVPLEDIRDLLPERGECGSEGYQYLCEHVEEQYAISRRRAPRRRFLPFAKTVLTVIVVSVITVYGWMTYRNLSRIGIDRLMNGDIKLSSINKPADVIENSLVASPEAVADSSAVIEEKIILMDEAAYPVMAPAEVSADPSAPSAVNTQDPSSLQPSEPISLLEAAVVAPEGTPEQSFSTGAFTGEQSGLSLNAADTANSLR